MSDFFRQAKERLVGGTSVADEHLQRLSLKYLQPEQKYMRGKSKDTEVVSSLDNSPGGKDAFVEQ